MSGSFEPGPAGAERDLLARDQRNERRLWLKGALALLFTAAIAYARFRWWT